jgi:hypothetical protein
MDAEEAVRAVAEELSELVAVLVAVEAAPEAGVDVGEVDSMGRGIQRRSQRMPEIRAWQRSQRCL